MLIDTHAHIYVDAFDDDREEVVRRAFDAGVEEIVMPAIGVPSIRQAMDLSEWYDGLHTMAALHPSEVKEASDADLEAVREWCEDTRIVAVGESGLDYYWDRTFDEKQKEYFRWHIRLAIESDLPLIIHNREATDDVLRILEEEKENTRHPERLRGILHCFVDPPEVAEKAWDLGFWVGLGGILTFSNSDVDDYAADIPLEQIVVETDSPYLAPEPHRGERNEPAYVRHVAQRLAEVKERSLEHVASVTSANAREIYGI
ncbi:MAG: YchF/TatD family DNA exonuclease [Bacteroidetes bacterium]|jgi:TatD DNase family protein|nr:YchF/TatD family DNA exonuclease [Bacteroidota bacterium]